MSTKATILLVDDEPSIVKMVGKRLQIEGYEVLIAMDGEEALHVAKSRRPQLIILDRMLPKMNGDDVCKTLKQDPAYAAIPIIMFSAKAQERDRLAGLECGANAYVTKPCKPEVLREQIEALLTNGSAPPASPGGTNA